LWSRCGQFVFRPPAEGGGGGGGGGAASGEERRGEERRAELKWPALISRMSLAVCGGGRLRQAALLLGRRLSQCAGRPHFRVLAADRWAAKEEEAAAAAASIGGRSKWRRQSIGAGLSLDVTATGRRAARPASQRRLAACYCLRPEFKLSATSAPPPRPSLSLSPSARAAVVVLNSQN